MKHLQQCEAVIFDLDGVLIDSSAVVKRQWRRWITEHGLDADLVQNGMHGQRTVEIVRLVAPHLNAEKEAARLAAREAADTDDLREIEGAIQVIRPLPRGAWAVVTSGNRDTARTRLRYAGLPVPDVLVTADDVTRGKPAPEAYLLAAEQLDVSPSRCVVIEDSPAGIASAHAAGMYVVAVTSTHTPAELEEADAITGSLLDIQILPVDGKSSQAAGLSSTLFNLIID